MLQNLVKRLKLDALEAALVDEGRRMRVEVLGRVRDSLRRELERIDTKIGQLSGGRRGARSRAGGRPRKGLGPRRKGDTFKDAVVRVFKKTGDSLHVNDLADMIKEVGFKTKATRSNLVVQAYRALKDTTLFKKVGRGIYALKD